MTVGITCVENDVLVLEVSFPLASTTLEGKIGIEQAVNEAGVVASTELLKRFDTDGGAIKVGTTKLTTKGKIEKIYHTPVAIRGYTAMSIKVPEGERLFVPWMAARIINSATPKLAKMLSHKYSKLSVDEVKADL
jgi:hypothetical protein